MHRFSSVSIQEVLIFLQGPVTYLITQSVHMCVCGGLLCKWRITTNKNKTILTLMKTLAETSTLNIFFFYFLDSGQDKTTSKPKYWPGELSICQVLYLNNWKVSFILFSIYPSHRKLVTGSVSREGRRTSLFKTNSHEYMLIKLDEWLSF